MKSILNVAVGMFVLCFAAPALSQSPSADYQRTRDIFQLEIVKPYVFNTGADNTEWIFRFALQAYFEEPSTFLDYMRLIGTKLIEAGGRQDTDDPVIEAFFAADDVLGWTGQLDLAAEMTAIAKSYADKTSTLDAQKKTAIYERLAAHRERAGYLHLADKLRSTTRSKQTARQSDYMRTDEERLRGALDRLSRVTSSALKPGQQREDILALVRSIGPLLKAVLDSSPTPELEDAILKALQVIGDRIAAEANEFGVFWLYIRAFYVEPHRALTPRMRGYLYDYLSQHWRSRVFSVKPAEIESVYAGMPEKTRMHLLAFCAIVSDGQHSLAPHKAIRQILEGDNSAMRSIFANDIDSAEAFGDSRGVWSTAIAAADMWDQLGDARLAAAFSGWVLQNIRLFPNGKPDPNWKERLLELSSGALYLTSLLAAEEVRNKRYEPARQWLVLAEDVVRNRLARVWKGDLRKTTEHLRNMRSPLRELAGSAAALSQAQDRTKFAVDVETALRFHQWSQLSEASLSVINAARTRFIADVAFQRLGIDADEAELAVASLDALVRAGILRPAPSRLQAERLAVVARAQQARATLERAIGADFVAPTPLGSGTLGASLQAGEAFVTSIMTATDIHFLMIYDGHIKLWKTQPSARDVAGKIRLLRAALDPAATPDAAAFPLDTAHELFAGLFGAVGDELLAARRVIFVPDRDLASLPMHVLLSRPAPAARLPVDGHRASGLSWLGARIPISTVPSVQAHLLLRGAPQSKAAQKFVGIGNPVLTGGSTIDRGKGIAQFRNRSGTIDPALVRSLAPLPETEDELRQVSAALAGRPIDLFVRERASEPVIQAAGLKTFRVISFATHGLLFGELGNLQEPALVLTPPAKATNDNDGLLTASEIARLQLDAEMVILSACNTGGGSGQGAAEALSGLAQAFFGAGARRLLVSHWAVPSNSTAALIVSISKNVSAAESKTWTEAHMIAIREMLSQIGPKYYAHPRYWGAFVVVGTN